MNEKLNIQNLILLLAKKHDIAPENAEEFVKTFFALIEEGLEQDKYVKVKGLGTFKLIEVGSRESVNVNTGERFEIQEHKKISFTPEPALKEIINRPFGHFETVVLNENVQFDDTPVEKEEEEDFETETGESMAATPTDPDRTEEPETVSTDNGKQPETAVPVIPENGTTEPEPAAEEPEPQPESVVPTPQTQPEQKTQGRGMKYFMAAVICVLAVCAGVIIYLYLPVQEAKDNSQYPQTEKMKTVGPTDTATAVRRDTVTATAIPAAKPERPDTEETEKESLQNMKKPAQSASPVQTKRAAKAPEPFTPDSVSYEIAGTQTEYTIKEGETLTRVSLKFYGTKALWPYLVKHNADILKNPNNVPSGTTIRIPKLVKKR